MDRTQDGFSRRDFIGRLAGGSTVVGLGLSETRDAFARTLHSIRGLDADTRDDGGYWEKVRQHFMLDDGFAYLNTGTLGPTPRPVVTAMNEYWRLMAVNPNENSAVFQNHVEQIRMKVAGVLGAAPDEIAITRNTTE
jgi:kynureninase